MMLTLLLFNEEKHNPMSMYYWLLAELLVDVPVVWYLAVTIPPVAWVLIGVGVFGVWWLVKS